ncbi:hypothetical protein B296_00055061 [Ensete ventricosum]|uniref:Uncharacterized protein n=1 Tax=Ensete ventricosum TaxID=4639 RepID=A0A426X3K7_ENSVE|nr:hypothetical protein B296_00055061 [Ensete ventricosum]
MPPIGAAGHGLATCKGAADCGQGPLQRATGCGKAPCKGATGCGQGPLQRAQSTAANTQGRQAPTGTVAYSVAPAGAADYSATSARGCSLAVRPQGQRQPAARPQISAARSKAIRAAHARGQPTEGQHPPPA